MKQFYTPPSLDIIYVESSDIITTSPGTESPIVPGDEGSWDW